MTDIEINKALALAIGYKSSDILEVRTDVEVWWHHRWEADWRVFDYRDWNVIGPIAEKYNCFPRLGASPDTWWAWCVDADAHSADTPQKAIALAVIEGAKK